MKISLFPIFLGCWLLSPNIVNADVALKFSQLQNAYSQAIKNIEESYSEKTASLESNGINGLKRQADKFRAEGQLSTYLEIKKYLDLYDRHLLNAENINSFQMDFIKDFHRNFESARAQLLEDEQKQQFEVMNMMHTHLQALNSESIQEGNPQLSALIQATIKSIEEDSQYQDSARKAREKHMAQNSQPSVTHYQPIATPTPTLIKTKPLLDVDVSKKAISQHAEGWDYDDKVQNIRLVISVRSKEMRRDYEKLTVKVWAFGQDVHSRKNFKMQIVDRLKVDGLMRGHTVELETKTFENIYDNNDSAKFGHKFYGYLLVIEDKDGVELFRKASPSRLDGKLEKIESMSEGEEFKL